jgi:hypothetical protein
MGGTSELLHIKDIQKVQVMERQHFAFASPHGIMTVFNPEQSIYKVNLQHAERDDGIVTTSFTINSITRKIVGAICKVETYEGRFKLRETPTIAEIQEIIRAQATMALDPLSPEEVISFSPEERLARLRELIPINPTIENSITRLEGLAKCSTEDGESQTVMCTIRCEYDDFVDFENNELPRFEVELTTSTNKRGISFGIDDKGNIRKQTLQKNKSFFDPTDKVPEEISQILDTALNTLILMRSDNQGTDFKFNKPMPTTLELPRGKGTVPAPTLDQLKSRPFLQSELIHIV